MNGGHEGHHRGQSAIMASLDPVMHINDHVETVKKSLPDVLSNELQSLSLVADRENNRLSFLLLDGEDNLSVSGYQEFCRKLGCESSTKTKVVSIVGNAGDGKSYALNKIFFHNEDAEHHEDEAFSTSASSEGSCTLGVWAAFEPRTQTLVLDTEGMLGVNYSGKELANENRRTRQLLKVLAISDVVIYKTRYFTITFSPILHMYNRYFYLCPDANVSIQTCFTFWAMLQKPSTTTLAKSFTR